MNADRWSEVQNGDVIGVGRGFVNAAILSTGRKPKSVAKAYSVRTAGVDAYVEADSIDHAQRIVETLRTIRPACDCWRIVAMED
jgi:hypothetical protein